MKHRIGVSIIWILLVAISTIAVAFDEGQDIQSRRGNPSPSASGSNIDDYTFQDEQVNLSPDDEDVLVLRTNQKNLVNRFVTATIPIKNATPREIRDVVRELVAKEGGRAEVIRDREKGENFLQVVCPAWQVEYIREAVPVLDQAWIREFEDGSVQAYYKAKNRSIVAVDNFASRWGGEGFSNLDRNNNAVLRSDEPSRINGYMSAAKLVDIPENQGRFIVKIYEIDTNNDLRLGLDYIAWKNGPGRNLFSFGFAGYEGEDAFWGASSILSPLFPGTLDGSGERVSRDFSNRSRFASFNYLITAAYVDFLASKGKAKTLAQGEIQVKSGSVGSFGSTDKVVSFAVLPNDPGPNGLTPTTVQQRGASAQVDHRELWRRPSGEVGVTVEIAPVILAESIEVDIFVNASSVSGLTPQKLPIINATRTQTEAVLVDGSTLVLSGLSRDEKIETKQGMPGLSSIPVLGWLFGGENNINRQKEIVVVIESLCERGEEATLRDAPEINTFARQVRGEEPVEIPSNRFGYDMWLLGERSGSNL